MTKATIAAAVFAALTAHDVVADERSDILNCAALQESVRRLDCYDGLARGLKQAGADTQRAASKEDAASATAALRAIKRLQTQVQTGISYQDYGRAVADARFEVRQFNEGAAARNQPDLARRLDAIIEHYVTANVVWRQRFGGSRVSDLLWDDEMANRLQGRYPQIAALKDKSLNRIIIVAAVTVIWAAAAEEIQRASASLP